MSTAEVHLLVSIVDDRARAVAGLTPADIRVMDNGVAVDALTAFEELDSRPTAVILLLDVSTSMSADLRRMPAWSESLAHHLALGPQDEFVPLVFAGRPDEWPSRLPTRFGSRESVTFVYDAVCATAGRYPPGEAQRRAALILVSDGADNGSWRGLAEATECARTANLAIYPVLPGHTTSAARRSMSALAIATGGVTFSLQSDSPKMIAQAVTAALHHGYLVGFRARADQPGAHAVQVRAKRGGVRTIHRQYYVVPPKRNPDTSDSR